MMAADWASEKYKLSEKVKIRKEESGYRKKQLWRRTPEPLSDKFQPCTLVHSDERHA